MPLRGLTPAERLTLAAARFHVYNRVELEDPDGAWRDVTAWAGQNYLVGAQWRRELDVPVMTGTLTLLRSAGAGSLSPMIQGSPLNKTALGAYAPFLRAHQRVRISTASIVADTLPVLGDYREQFRGRIDDPEWGGTDNAVTLAMSDDGVWLNALIQVTRTYGSGVGIPMVDVLRAVLTDNPVPKLGGVVPLFAPVDPFWNVRTLEIAAGTPLLQALRDIAAQRGWEVRFKYDDAGTFRLTLYEPQRDKVVADTTFGPQEYITLSAVRTPSANIRNHVLVKYIDAATGVHSSRFYRDDASVLVYGEQFLQLAEDKTSSISSASEAQRLADFVGHDLHLPPVEQVMRTLYFWPAELGDLYGYDPDAVHYDTAIALAVVSVAHNLTKDTTESEIQCRGTVAGLNSEWLEKGTNAAGAAQAQIIGATLDVRAVADATTYTIYYTSLQPVQLSINNGAYAPAPASPVLVSRPAAGTNPLIYAFRALTLDGQYAVDTIEIAPQGGLDSDTVSPDLAVVQSVPVALTQDFTATATNPKAGGPAPTITVQLRGTTGVNVTTGAALADGTVYAVAASDVIRANRPAFGQTTGASVEFRASITGGGAERIQRSILPQVKLSFGPSFDVRTTPGALTYSIAYTGTPLLSINGGIPSAPPASPISVTRPAAGASSLEYSFQSTLDGQTVNDTVLIPAVDKDTVTADLSVVPDTTTALRQDFIVNGTNPSGGPTPILEGLIRGTTGLNASTATPLSDGVVFTISPGQTITVYRAPFDTAIQASVTFFATLSGAAVEKIQRSILNQVKTVFGPSLDVKGSTSSTQTTITYVGSGGTVQLSIDGGAYSTAPASPIIVTRDTADHVYAFRIVADGQTVPGVATVPALAAGAVTTNRFGGLSVNGNDSTNQIVLNWTFSGEAGVVFRVLSGQGSAVPSNIESENASSGFGYPSSYDLVPSGGGGSVTFRATVEAVGTDGSTLASVTNSHAHRVAAL